MKHFAIRLPKDVVDVIESECVKSGKGTATVIREFLQLGIELKQRSEDLGVPVESLLKVIDQNRKSEMQNLVCTMESLFILRDLAKESLNRSSDEQLALSRKAATKALSFFANKAEKSVVVKSEEEEEVEFA